MSLDGARLLAHVHGHLGWLAVAALAHPALLLRGSTRRSTLTVALAPLLATVAAGTGFVVYGPYRARVKGPLFVEAEAWGWMFERKEHLAFAAVALAWAGAAAYLAAERSGEPAHGALRRASHRAFVAACALALVAAVIATLVASVREL